MQNRIDRLEGLVLSLMTNGAQAPGATAANEALSSRESYSASTASQIDPGLDESQMMDDDDDGRTEESETDGVTKSFGIMKVDAEKQKTFYVGEAHWAALLNEIGDIKNYFVHHRKEYEEQMDRVAQSRKDAGGDSGAGPALLFGATTPPSRGEILGHLPSRYMSDILIGRYFNTFDPATHILHNPTFQKQYNAHWADQSKSSIVWVAMLFAMMRLAMLSYAKEGDEPPEFRGKCKDMSNNYRTQMAHCLITADYTKPHNFIIETLVFHLHAEYTTNRDSEASVWVLVGMIARLAMRMGFHRDSKLFPNITPFQGEMRRRVWSFVRQADLLFSFQVALPAMIRIGDSDTDLPRNIYDDEFDENSTSLPPARPSSEATPVSYMIAKSRLAFGFGRVLEEINGIHGRKHDEIMKIDRGLRDIFASIPEHLKLRPMSEQSLSPITLIMAQYSLATVYHKSQIVLHRRFIKLARASNRYMQSRRTCIDSAMQLLSFQAMQFAESGERGRMRSLRNYVNSLATHDFLLAATVLCHDLYFHRNTSELDASTPSTTYSGSSGGSSSNSSDSLYIPGLSYRREDLFRTLETSRDIWWSQRDVSMEAYKASELLNVLLQSSSGSTSLTMIQESPSLSRTNTSNNDEQNAAMTLGLLQSGAMTPNTAAASLNQTRQGQGYGTGGIFDNKYMLDGNLFGALQAPDPSVNTVFGSTNNAPSPFPMSGMFNSGDLVNNMNVDWVSDVHTTRLGFDTDKLCRRRGTNSCNRRTSLSTPLRRCGRPTVQKETLFRPQHLRRARH